MVADGGCLCVVVVEALGAALLGRAEQVIAGLRQRAAAQARRHGQGGGERVELVLDHPAGHGAPLKIDATAAVNVRHCSRSAPSARRPRSVIS